MKKMKGIKPLLVIISVVVYLFVIPFLYEESRYLLNVIIQTSAFSLIAMGVWITFTLGLVNIGQGVFCAIGGYTTAILSQKYGLSFWLCLPLSGFIAAFFGVLIGSPILRLKGIYFAMTTLVLGETVRLFLMNGGKFTGGPDGIVGVPRPGAISISGLTVIPAFETADYLSYYFLAAFLLIGSLLLVWRLDRSRLGQTFKAIKQSDTLASSIGIKISTYRIIAFGCSCFLGGIGGSFFVGYMTSIDPDFYTVWDSINFILYCFLGGLEYLLGPIVGTFILAGSFESLRFLEQYQLLIYACIMISAILWLPNGLLSIGLGNKNSDSVQEDIQRS